MATYYFRNNTSSWNTASNWSTSSGGAADGAVPTSADNAIFDSNSGACNVDTASANCNAITFTSYTNTITMTNDIRVYGNILLSGSSVTATGSGTLFASSGTTSITSNGFTWGGNLKLNGTVTLIDDMRIGGTLSNTGGVTVNGTFNLYIAGSVNLSSVLTGTLTIIMNGNGSVSTNGTANGTRINGFTINTSGSITFTNASTTTFTSINNTFTFTYTAGTVVFTGSTIQFQGTSTGASQNIVFNNISGLTFNNVIFQLGASGNYTLNSAMYISGTTTFTSPNNYTVPFNGSNLYLGSVTCSNTGVVQSTSTSKFIFYYGGTFNGNAAFVFSNNIDINCSGNTLNMSGTMYYNTGTLNYISGNVLCDQTSNLIVTTCTLNTTGMSWNQLTFNGGTSTLILGSNLYCNSVLCGTNGTMVMTINGPYTLYIGYNGNVGTFTNGPVGGASFINGTATIEIGGQGGIGYMNCTGVRNLQIQINFNFNFKGTLIIQDAIAPPNLNVVNNPLVTQTLTWLTFNGGSNTYTYKSGNIITKNVYNGLGSTLVCGYGTFINFDKIPFGYVLFISNTTTTFNRFFNGSPKVITQIGTTDPTVATANYTVQFQDGFEKISNFVKINNCTMSKPLQLLVLNPKGNKGNNVGIRYINQVPNGIARKTPIIPNNLTGSEITPMTGGLLADPATGL